ncbi:hypothetical protein NCCP691_35460 [Noviherbaspirillum aridicola]|uniref:Uncharacterized protein n=1 Tax=Noviherbaspirillum aridicola TaxID=2849687 RepID=A0ABQ4Q8J9_9BURK|nr:hypothetical protein NCCP691_35460 [Noviherbaspirillum aridicola]
MPWPLAARRKKLLRPLLPLLKHPLPLRLLPLLRLLKLRLPLRLLRLLTATLLLRPLRLLTATLPLRLPRLLRLQKLPHRSNFDCEKKPTFGSVFFCP